MVKKNNSRLFIVLGILAIVIILGSILGSKYIEKFTNSDKTLIYFYMNTCQHCNEFETEWNNIEDLVKNKNKYSDINLKKIDLQSPEGREYKEITGAPTIMILPSKKIYSGQRMASPILEWSVVN